MKLIDHAIQNKSSYSCSSEEKRASKCREESRFSINFPFKRDNGSIGAVIMILFYKTLLIKKICVHIAQKGSKKENKLEDTMHKKSI